ncbi:hypothetical protein F442_01530 [Phytophthora nicotianae P10297]|uniref:Uncharacterized protein n=1 Tax=Phytophthora nicotianae P10297 TaxID=1317064 RepID=W3A1R8_PHYNI|nr:hypothetical protein F442_01530 [Phytophthora nicotianae P10297]
MYNMCTQPELVFKVAMKQYLRVALFFNRLFAKLSVAMLSLSEGSSVG